MQMYLKLYQRETATINMKGRKIAISIILNYETTAEGRVVKPSQEAGKGAIIIMQYHFM